MNHSEFDLPASERIQHRLPFLLFAFLLFAIAPASKGGQAMPKSRESWIEAVKKDAKVSALVANLGAPDMIKADGGFTRYYWLGKVYAGTSSPESLIVFVEPYKGEKLVIGLTDGTLADIYWFSWATKVRPGL